LLVTILRGYSEETKNGKIRGSNPGRGKIFSPKIHTSSRAQPASNTKDTEDSSSGDTATGPESENYLNIVLRLGMSGNIPPPPLQSGYRGNFTFSYGLK
jgi:hypothetical protein